MTLVVITPPTEEPLTLAEVRAHLRIDEVTYDASLAGYVIAARERVEHELSRSVIAKTYELTLDEFPAGTIELPMAPVIPGTGRMAIVSVKYTDSAGVEQTVSGAAYSLDAYSHRPRLTPVNGWPTVKDEQNAVRIRYTSGLPASDVPQAVRQWMLLQIGSQHEHRESVAAWISGGREAATLPFVDRLLDPYRSYT